MILLTICVYEPFVAIIAIMSRHIIWYVFLIILVLPIINFLIIHIITRRRVKTFLRRLDECSVETKNTDDFTAYESSHSFDKLNIRTEGQAIFASRVACLASHSSIADLSFIQYLIEQFPNITFQCLCLCFLIQNQRDNTIQLLVHFLDMKPPTMLQIVVLFQMRESLDESSNELSQSIMREISKRNLHMMKCQQFITKFWSSCYKGDINMMSKYAVSLHKGVTELCVQWKNIALRYPFSLPVLREYVKYLSTIGAKHWMAEKIVQNHSGLQQDFGTTQFGSDTTNLHAIVEDVVDKRDVKSLKKFFLSFWISTAVAFLILVASVVVSIIYINKFRNCYLFLKHSQHYQVYLPHVLNVHDDLVFNDTTQNRKNLYKITAQLENSLNPMLENLPESLMTIRLHEFYEDVDLYNETAQNDVFDSLRLMSLYSHSLTYTPVNDSLLTMIKANMLFITSAVNDTNIDEIEIIDKMIHDLVRFSPVFYVGVWFLLIIVCVPLLYISLSSTKIELAYLYSLYLSIPRQKMQEYFDDCQQVEKKGLTKTGQTTGNSFAIPFNLTLTSKETEEEKKKSEIAGTLKMLSGDNANVNSVIPPRFMFNASFLFITVVGLLGLVATIIMIIFISSSKQLRKEFWTVHLLIERQEYASLIVHGITSFNQDFGKQSILEMLDKFSSRNQEIIFPSDTLSLKMLNDDTIYNIHHTFRCQEALQTSCYSLVHLYEEFYKQAMSAEEQITSSVNTNDEYRELRRLMNDELEPLSMHMISIADGYVGSRMNRMLIVTILVSVLSVISIFCLILFFIIPKLKLLTDNAESVKLPLKYMSPYDIPDYPKIMQFLHDEHKFEKESNKAQDNQMIFNALTTPFCIFEDDMTLLFGNNAFYEIMKTTREESVGLPLLEIFQTALYLHDDHPFNSMLDTIYQIRRGVSPIDRLEINTILHCNIPVVIKMIYLEESKNFLFSIVDLSNKQKLQEKTKYETLLTKKLLDDSIPRRIINTELEPVSYQNVPILAISIRFNDPDDDTKDDYLLACSKLKSSFEEVRSRFPKVSQITQEPPNWLFLSNSDDTTVACNDLATFALSTIEVFSIHNVTKNGLSLVIASGDIRLVPIKIELPYIELFGTGYQTIKNMIKEGIENKLIVANDIEQLLKGNDDLIILNNMENDFHFAIVMRNTDEKGPSAREAFVAEN